MPYSTDHRTYPAEFLNIWVQAAKAEVRLPYPTRGKATSLRHKLNAYRRALTLANHPLAIEANKAELTLEEEAGMWVVVARPSGGSLPLPQGFQVKSEDELIKEMIEKEVKIEEEKKDSAAADLSSAIGSYLDDKRN